MLEFPSVCLFVYVFMHAILSNYLTDLNMVPSNVLW